jgi:hypothetical protein
MNKANGDWEAALLSQMFGGAPMSREDFGVFDV